MNQQGPVLLMRIKKLNKYWIIDVTYILFAKVKELHHEYAANTYTDYGQKQKDIDPKKVREFCSETQKERDFEDRKELEKIALDVKLYNFCKGDKKKIKSNKIINLEKKMNVFITLF